MDNIIDIFNENNDYFNSQFPINRCSYDKHSNIDLNDLSKILYLSGHGSVVYNNFINIKKEDGIKLVMMTKPGEILNDSSISSYLNMYILQDKNDAINIVNKYSEFFKIDKIKKFIDFINFKYEIIYSINYYSIFFYIKINLIIEILQEYLKKKDIEDYPDISDNVIFKTSSFLKIMNKLSVFLFNVDNVKLLSHVLNDDNYFHIFLRNNEIKKINNINLFFYESLCKFNDSFNKINNTLMSKIFENVANIFENIHVPKFSKSGSDHYDSDNDVHIKYGKKNKISHNYNTANSPRCDVHKYSDYEIKKCYGNIDKYCHDNFVKSSEHDVGEDLGIFDLKNKKSSEYDANKSSGLIVKKTSEYDVNDVNDVNELENFVYSKKSNKIIDFMNEIIEKMLEIKNSLLKEIMSHGNNCNTNMSLFNNNTTLYQIPVNIIESNILNKTFDNLNFKLPLNTTFSYEKNIQNKTINFEISIDTIFQYYYTCQIYDTSICNINNYIKYKKSLNISNLNINLDDTVLFDVNIIKKFRDFLKIYVKNNPKINEYYLNKYNDLISTISTISTTQNPIIPSTFDIKPFLNKISYYRIDINLYSNYTEFGDDLLLNTDDLIDEIILSNLYIEVCDNGTINNSVIYTSPYISSQELMLSGLYYMNNDNKKYFFKTSIDDENNNYFYSSSSIRLNKLSLLNCAYLGNKANILNAIDFNIDTTLKSDK